MPIDPRIALGVQPVQTTSPLETLSTLAQLQGLREQTEARRLAADKARQAAADEATIRTVMTQAGGDVDKALPQLRMINPRAAVAFEEQVGKARKESFEALKNDMEYRGKRLDLGLKVWGSVTDQPSLDAARPMVLAIDPSLDAVLPTTYDPSAVQRVTDIALTAKERQDKKQDALKLFTEGKAQEALGTSFSTATSQPEWDSTAAWAAHQGVPRELIAQFGDTFSPEAVARAGQLAISPAKREELAGQAATRTQTAAHQTVEEANAAAQLAVAQGQLGVARGHLAVSQAAEARQAAAAKAAPGGVKLSPAQQEDIATMMTVQQLAQDATTLGTETHWGGVGPWEGRVGATPLGSGGAKGEELRNKLGNIQATIAKLRGGTSFTPNEQALLETYTPTITDTETKIRTKLATLADFIETKRKNTLRVAAGDYTLPAPGGAATTTTGTNPFRK